MIFITQISDKAIWIKKGNREGSYIFNATLWRQLIFCILCTAEMSSIVMSSVVLLLYLFFNCSRADDAIPTCKELVLFLELWKVIFFTERVFQALWYILHDLSVFISQMSNNVFIYAIGTTKNVVLVIFGIPQVRPVKVSR